MAAAYVQSANNIAAAGVGTTAVKVFGSAVAAGALLVASATWGTGAGGATFADTVNLTWTATVVTVNDGGNACSFSTSYFPNSAVGTPIVTATVPLADNRGIIITEYSGVATSSPVDGTPSATAIGSGTTKTSGTVTVSQANDLVYGFVVDDGNGSATITSTNVTIHGGATGQNPAVSNSVAMAAGDKTGPASGTTTTVFTFSVSGAAIILCMCFKQATASTVPYLGAVAVVNSPFSAAGAAGGRRLGN